MEGKCVLCGEGIHKFVSVNVTRGLETLRTVSLKRKDGISEQIEGVSQVRVHVQCRKNYTCHRNRVLVSSEAPGTSPKLLLRSDLPQFDFKTDCLYCGGTVEK